MYSASAEVSRPFLIGGAMKKDYRIITNNPLVREKLGQDHDVEFYDCSYEDVLKKVKEEVFATFKVNEFRNLMKDFKVKELEKEDWQ